MLVRGWLKRGVRGLAALLALGCAVPAAASATDYYAEHGGSGAGCTQATPCTLPTAVSNATQNGDRVILLASGGDFSINAALSIPHAIDFGGQPGQPIPTIDDSSSIGIDSFGGASLHDFTLLDPAGDPALESLGGSVDRVFVEGGFFACELGGGVVMKDSVCWGVASNGAAVRNPSSGGGVTLRNVTVEETGTTSLGIDLISSPSTPIPLNAANVIARGSFADVHGENPTTTMTFTNSNYATVEAQGGSTITPAGTGGNQTTPPVFAGGVGNFQQALGSPTVDAGAATGDLGVSDITGAPRVQGPCVGGAGPPDIGAYELQPPRPSPSCSAFQIGTLRLKKKKGTGVLTVTVPGAGTLSEAGKGVKAANVTASQAGTLSVPVRAAGKARRALARHHKVKLRLKLTWSPTGNTPATQSEKVKLKKR